MAADIHSIMQLVRRLCRRPRRGELPGDSAGRGHNRQYGLPMLCLVRPETSRDGLRAALATELTTALPRRVPHAIADAHGRSWVGAAEENEVDIDADVHMVRALLTLLATQLAGEENSGAGRIRFRRFGLATWLMDQVSTARRPLEPGRWLADRLRTYDLARGPWNSARFLDTTPAPGRLAIVIRALVRWVPPLWSRLRCTGRIPIVSGKYRWFLRKQPYLTPRDPGSFLGFAQRLTAKEVGRQDADQLQCLLVHAFLADLHDGFGHRGWPWRLAGPRRMSYLVAVLDGISRDNRGYQLLKIVNDVRTETGQFDPLLLISTSTMVPPHAREAEAGDLGIGQNAGDAYEQWQNTFVDDRRAGKATAWYLPIRVTDHGSSPTVRIEAATPPWWSRRWVPVLATLLLAATALAPAARWGHRHCGEMPWSSSTVVRTSGHECIGVSDGSYLFSPDNPKLAAVQRVIRRQNAEAARGHQLNPDQPYIQFVYLAALSSTSAPPEPQVAVREGLEGVAALQRRQLDDRSPSRILIRILVANAGARMTHGTQVASIIRSMAAADPSIVGVVGFHQSRQQVRDTISQLSKSGLPMVAATLSADNMPDASPLYFQVSPQNRREARVAAAFAPALLGDNPHHVRIVHPVDRTDIYAKSLAGDAARSFHRHGFAVQDVPFRPRNAATAGRDSCGFRGLVFYAGRPNEFAGFLRGVNQHCRDEPPRILASDDMSRYAADSDLRTRFTSIPFDYVSFAVGSPACGTRNGPSADVYQTIKRLFRFECRRSPKSEDNDPSLDGHALLAYDATWCLTVAAQQLNNDTIPISPGGVWRKLSALQLDGRSGHISFGTGQHPQVPPDKAIAILRVQHGSVQETPYRCGHLPGGITPNAACPDHGK